MNDYEGTNECHLGCKVLYSLLYTLQVLSPFGFWNGKAVAVPRRALGRYRLVLQRMCVATSYLHRNASGSLFVPDISLTAIPKTERRQSFDPFHCSDKSITVQRTVRTPTGALPECS